MRLRRIGELFVSRQHAMKAPHRKLAVGVVLVCLCIASAYFILQPDPYARLERMGKSALRLSLPGAAPSISDHIIGALHRCEPRFYFTKEAQKEQEKLLAAGLLVEFKIAIPSTRSQREVYQAFAKSYQKTGAYWAATVDPTNRVVLLISKPKDVASFTAALENE